MRSKYLMLGCFVTLLATGCLFEPHHDQRIDRTACFNHQKQLLVEIFGDFDALKSKGKNFEPIEKVLEKLSAENKAVAKCPICKASYDICPDIEIWTNPKKVGNRKAAICCKCKHGEFVAVNFQGDMLRSQKKTGLESLSWE